MKKTLYAVSIAGLLAIPVLAQQSPESILPPGFNDPPASKAPAQPSTPNANPSPNGGNDNGAARPASGPSNAASDSPRREDRGSSGPRKRASNSAATQGSAEEGEEEEIRYDVPEAARRSLKAVGFIGENNGGFPTDAYGTTDGLVLKNILTHTNGPLVSRWGSIMTTRLLASRTTSPEGISPADWVAERAWLLLRMGQSTNARQLVQQIDAGDYSERMYVVAMQAFLANADLAGFCPHADRANIILKDDKPWTMARAICASLAGEQANATAYLNRAKAKRVMVGVDFLLTEKAIGAGRDGRRSVKIEWDKAKGFNSWRHGLANATGVIPPASYYAESGKHLAGWNALLPMLPIGPRVNASYEAAALGVLSNRAMTDVMAQVPSAENIDESTLDRANALGKAYSAGEATARVDALNSIWTSAADDRQLHGMLVMTARAAAAMPVADYGDANDNLIRSMMTAGFDSSAAGWYEVIEEGSLGYGLLMVGAPGFQGKVTYNQLDSFYDNDTSTSSIKSKFLLAATAGLGRLEAGAEVEFAEELGISLSGTSNFTRAIEAASARGESGTVALLAAAGLQGSTWTDVEPRTLYHIIKALSAVGREAEARMIAAEAVSFG